jgi:hypothetical protein
MQRPLAIVPAKTRSISASREERDRNRRSHNLPPSPGKSKKGLWRAALGDC